MRFERGPQRAREVCPVQPEVHDDGVGMQEYGLLAAQCRRRLLKQTTKPLIRIGTLNRESMSPKDLSKEVEIFGTMNNFRPEKSGSMSLCRDLKSS